MPFAERIRGDAPRARLPYLAFVHPPFDDERLRRGLPRRGPGASRRGRLRRHFDHSVWLNTIPESDCEHAYGSVTIRKIREVFPMFQLTVDGLTAATKKLMVRY